MIFTDPTTRNDYFDCLIDAFKAKDQISQELSENMIINLSRQEQSKLMLFLLSQQSNLHDDDLNTFIVDVIFNKKDNEK